MTLYIKFSHDDVHLIDDPSLPGLDFFAVNCFLSHFGMTFFHISMELDTTPHSFNLCQTLIWSDLETLASALDRCNGTGLRGARLRFRAHGVSVDHNGIFLLLLPWRIVKSPWIFAEALFVMTNLHPPWHECEPGDHPHRPIMFIDNWHVAETQLLEDAIAIMEIPVCSCCDQSFTHDTREWLVAICHIILGFRS